MVCVLKENISASNAFETKEKLYSLIDGSHDLVIDMTYVDLIDSTGLGVLVSIHKRLQGSHQHLYLKNVQPKVRRILKITMLDQVVEII